MYVFKRIRQPRSIVKINQGGGSKRLAFIVENRDTLTGSGEIYFLATDLFIETGSGA